MFSILRQRLGLKSSSFNDLNELDSNDSVNFSLKHSPVSSISSSNGLDIDIDAKRKVVKILRLIKHIETRPQMSLIEFMDMIRTQHYDHVSLSLFRSFMNTCTMIPKPYNIHYYMYFLYYAIYYHHTRSTVDVIDDQMTETHSRHLVNVQKQLRCLRRIIADSRVREISL